MLPNDPVPEETPAATSGRNAPVKGGPEPAKRAGDAFPSGKEKTPGNADRG